LIRAFIAQQLFFLSLNFSLSFFYFPSISFVPYFFSFSLLFSKKASHYVTLRYVKEKKKNFEKWGRGVNCEEEMTQ
jgi:hypothetical protein